MALEPDFLALMSSTLTYEPLAALDGYGGESFGTTLDLPCHITYKRKILRGNTTEEAVSTAQIQLPPPGFVVPSTSVTTPTVAINDRVILPQDGVERKVLDITLYTDETGAGHHQSASLT